jgi:hypothetical protein
VSAAFVPLLAAAWLAIAAPPPPEAADGASPSSSPTVAHVAAAPAADEVKGLDRVVLEIQPFLGLTSNSWGSLGQLRYEHYFRAPLLVGVELSPFALASSGEGLGALAEARVHAAFATKYLAVGLGVGEQLERFGRNGLSIAPTLRLGKLDGLGLSLEYAYSVAANQYTGRRTVGFSNVLGAFRVPLAERVALQVQGGLNLQSWAFFMIGVRHRLTGDGGPGTWFVSGAFGAAWIADRSPCNFDAEVPCGPSALSFGPTIGFGLERRF